MFCYVQCADILAGRKNVRCEPHVAPEFDTSALNGEFLVERQAIHIVLSQRSPITFVSDSCDKPDEFFDVYHVSTLMLFLNYIQTQSPMVPLKKRGRSRKQPLIPGEAAGENAKLCVSASVPFR
ncbi:hypothetical protein TNCV_2371041 [Trichonephila clavipes]|nr:hypothetical protein TNCV_2371041 [Trichonephila clavipes]